MALAIFTAPRASAAAPSTPEQVVKSPNRTKEVYTQSKQNPLTAYFGRLNNPDPTLAKFGGGQGFELFYNLRRQITELGGIVGQLVDDVLKRRPRIVPGDGSNKDSVAVADQVRRLWDDIPRKAVVLRKTVDTLITCGFAPMELVWSRDPSSRIVAPLGMRRPDGSRGPGLIDRPAQNFILDIDQQWRFLSTLDPFNGEAIEPLKFIFLVAGSSNTEHGESAFTDLYSAAWFYQQIRQMMLDAVEKYGRPVPHVLIPRTMRPEDIAREDQFYTEKFGCYTRDFHDGDKVIVDYPTMPLAAAGAAGKSEIEVLKFLQSTMYIHLLRTPQTQDATGGSRALETTRNAIKDLASLTYTDILIEGLQEGWMRPVMEINFPSLEPQLWSRFEPDPTAAEDPEKVHRRLTDGVDRGVRYSKRWYFGRFGFEEAKDEEDVLGRPDIRATTPSVVPPTTAAEEDAQ